MQRIRNRVVLIAMIMTIALSMLLCACGDVKVQVRLVKNDEKLVMIEALATGGSLEDALNELKTKGELDYVGSQSEYGCYLISINGYVPDAAEHEFWAIYTSLTEYDGVTYSNEEFGTYDYAGETYVSAAYGISGMPLVSGYVYILAVTTY
ncbi:MAG: hypothetical protein OSJ83_06925 [Clostridia bacterium]|nr:hypothetical protein [Clostridia bacterium]